MVPNCANCLIYMNQITYYRYFYLKVNCPYRHLIHHALLSDVIHTYCSQFCKIFQNVSNFCICFSQDKRKALEETKSYASQSLASVAYQIHSLAVNMLQLMDQQDIQLQHMMSNANNIGLVWWYISLLNQQFLQ